MKKDACQETIVIPCCSSDEDNRTPTGVYINPNTGLVEPTFSRKMLHHQSFARPTRSSNSLVTGSSIRMQSKKASINTNYDARHANTDRSEELSRRSQRSKLQKLAHKDANQLDDQPVDPPDLSGLDHSTSIKKDGNKEKTNMDEPNR